METTALRPALFAASRAGDAARLRNLLTVGTVPASENTFDCARQYLMGLAERAPRQVCQYV